MSSFSTTIALTNVTTTASVCVYPCVLAENTIRNLLHYYHKEFVLVFFEIVLTQMLSICDCIWIATAILKPGNGNFGIAMPFENFVTVIME